MTSTFKIACLTEVGFCYSLLFQIVLIYDQPNIYFFQTFALIMFM